MMGYGGYGYGMMGYGWSWIMMIGVLVIVVLGVLILFRYLHHSSATSRNDASRNEHIYKFSKQQEGFTFLLLWCAIVLLETSSLRSFNVIDRN